MSLSWVLLYWVQGTLKGEVSLYCWPPVWLVWNQLYGSWKFSFLFAKQTNLNRSNRRSTVQWYFPLKCYLLSVKLAICLCCCLISCKVEKNIFTFFKKIKEEPDAINVKDENFISSEKFLHSRLENRMIIFSKKLYSVTLLCPPGYQCYKTFYGHKLRLFLIS